MKFKRYCESNISSFIYINKVKSFNLDEILIKLLIKYYDYTNVFNKIKVDKLFLYYFYNYKIEFIKRINKNILSKNKTNFISNYKLE